MVVQKSRERKITLAEGTHKNIRFHLKAITKKALKSSKNGSLLHLWSRQGSATPDRKRDRQQNIFLRDGSADMYRCWIPMSNRPHKFI